MTIRASSQLKISLISLLLLVTSFSVFLTALYNLKICYISESLHSLKQSFLQVYAAARW